MTPQERAAIQSFYYRLHAGVEGGEFQERYEQEDIGCIIELLDETRRAALLEAAKVVCPYCNAPGQWELMSNSGYHQYGEAGHSLARCRATAIHEMLDRLREGV